MCQVESFSSSHPIREPRPLSCHSRAGGQADIYQVTSIHPALLLFENAGDPEAFVIAFPLPGLFCPRSGHGRLLLG